MLEKRGRIDRDPQAYFTDRNGGSNSTLDFQQTAPAHLYPAQVSGSSASQRSNSSDALVEVTNDRLQHVGNFVPIVRDLRSDLANISTRVEGVGMTNPQDRGPTWHGAVPDPRVDCNLEPDNNAHHPVSAPNLTESQTGDALGARGQPQAWRQSALDPGATAQQIGHGQALDMPWQCHTEQTWALGTEFPGNSHSHPSGDSPAQLIYESETPRARSGDIGSGLNRKTRTVTPNGLCTTDWTEAVQNTLIQFGDDNLGDWEKAAQEALAQFGDNHQIS